MTDRVILIVLDACGAGELPDARAYGDTGSNTLGNVARAVGGLHLPHLERLGLGKIIPIEGVSPAVVAEGCYGKLAERSPGKDSTTGHWEIAGIFLEKPFPVYPHGFPPEVIGPFEQAVGRKVLGNKPASGTEILKELGAEHHRTGRPIVYTSADSVFQIAAHEEVIPLGELYQMCQTAREILAGDHAVGRVIARPFVGATPENFKRTANRRDFSLPPPAPTVLDQLKAADYPVIAIGKIEDLFAGQGVTQAVHTRDNAEVMQAMTQAVAETGRGLIFANLVDFDTIWGHRNDVPAFAGGLERFDRHLGELIPRLRPDDLLIITADHGCDPTTPSTDHSREYVPLLVYGQRLKSDVNLGTRSSFADVGATIAEIFRLPGTGNGKSFWQEIAAA